jgi:acyl carrier protein
MEQSSADEYLSYDAIKEGIREWIKSEPLAERPEVVIDDNTELLSSGYIDSLDMMRLVAFIEQRFDVPLPEEQLISSHFRTVTTLADLVVSQQDLARSVAG